ncbi:MAG TPA: hypothetical protein VE093_47355 [Polyangiaceae bacterium]|nr:hypothetical protein [Polyangiaceae bacterium]
MRLNYDSPDLSKQAFPTSAGLSLEARAMYPWQRLFVTDPELRLDAAARDAFVQTLERLFPGADTSRFMPRLLR